MIGLDYLYFSLLRRKCILTFSDSKGKLNNLGRVCYVAASYLSAHSAGTIKKRLHFIRQSKKESSQQLHNNSHKC